MLKRKVMNPLNSDGFSHTDTENMDENVHYIVLSATDRNFQMITEGKLSKILSVKL